MDSNALILIAEDDAEDRFIMSETFQELGYQDAIILMEDGRMLVEYLDSKGLGKIKLIVLDLNMPRLNGTETLRVLKNDNKYKHIPVMIFSTSVNLIEKEMCMDLGAIDYISKPLKYAEYLETCKNFYSIAQGA